MATMNVSKAKIQYGRECVICGAIVEQQDEPFINYKTVVCDECKEAILKVRAAITAGRLDI